MLPSRLTIWLLLAIALFFIIVLTLLKKKRLALKYTLLWLLTGVLMLVLVLCPSILFRVSALLGIQSSMNGLYLLLIAFILMILMSLTSIVSAQTDRIRRLAQSVALLEERMRQLEAKIGEDGTEKSKEYAEEMKKA